MDRALTDRERAVLDFLLAVDFEGADDLRQQAAHVRVVDMCGCGCPSIDFHKDPGVGMHARVSAQIRGTHDSLFLYTLGSQLGGIEYAGTSDEGDPSVFPDPSLLEIEPA